MDTKKCSKCGEDKPLHEYPKDRRNSDGRFGYCRCCYRLQHRAWRSKGIKSASPAAIREKGQRERRDKHAQVRARQKRYEEKHPARNLESKLKWYRANKEQADTASRQAYRKSMNELSDSYLAHALTANDGISRRSIPKHLIEAKRVHLQIHRLLRDLTK